jgi:hypothetical protein
MDIDSTLFKQYNKATTTLDTEARQAEYQRCSPAYLDALDVVERIDTSLKERGLEFQWQMTTVKGQPVRRLILVSLADC